MKDSRQRLQRISAEESFTAPIVKTLKGREEEKKKKKAFLDSSIMSENSFTGQKLALEQYLMRDKHTISKIMQLAYRRNH